MCAVTFVFNFRTNKEELRHLESQRQLNQSIQSFVQDNTTETPSIGNTTDLPILEHITRFSFNTSDESLDIGVPDNNNSEMAPIMYMVIYTVLITLAVIFTSVRYDAVIELFE